MKRSSLKLSLFFFFISLMFGSSFWVKNSLFGSKIGISYIDPASKENLQYSLITAEELLKKVKKKEKMILIDCRPEEEYRAGHIPGAVNVSIDSYAFGNTSVLKKEIGKIIDDVGKDVQFILIDAETGEEYMPKTKLIELIAVLPEDRDEEVVFYCRRPDCTRSPMAARWAVALGYRNIFRYEGSWEDWSKKGYPVEK